MIVIATHDHADFDGFAAMVAARRLHGGDAAMVLGRPVAQHVHAFQTLHKAQLPVHRERDLDLDAVERLVVVDTCNARRLKSVRRLVERAREPERPFVVELWDHHRASSDDLVGDERNVAPVGAVTTLLVERLRAEGHRLPQVEATALAIGIHADTGSLAFPNTTARDAEALAWLLAQGAHLPMIGHYLRTALEPEQRAALLAVIDAAEPRTLAGVEVALATVRLPHRVSGLAEVTSEALQAGGHDALFVVYASDDKAATLIGRASAPWVDVGGIMRALGGGGHRGAGAVTLKGCTAAEARARLEACLDEHPPEPRRVHEVMSSPVQCVPHDLPLRELERLLHHQDFTGAPVVKGERLVGVISQVDLAKARERGHLDRKVRSCMSQNVATTAPDEALDDALARMVDRNVGRLPVLDGERVVGILTRTDLLRVLYGDSRG